MRWFGIGLREILEYGRGCCCLVGVLIVTTSALQDRGGVVVPARGTFFLRRADCHAERMPNDDSREEYLNGE